MIPEFKKLEQSIQQMIVNGSSIQQAVDEYLSKDAVKYLFKTNKDKLKFRKKQYNLYYKVLQTFYREIKQQEKRNVEEKQKLREDIKSLK